MLKSWKTTLAGILQFLAIVSTQIMGLLDLDPMTNPDWSLVVASFVTLWGLLTARDNDVSSEDAKAVVTDKLEAAKRVKEALDN